MIAITASFIPSCETGEPELSFTPIEGFEPPPVELAEAGPSEG